jgi:hypothetical protein
LERVYSLYARVCAHAMAVNRALAATRGSSSSGGLSLAAISAVFTIAYVANLLGEDKDWLFDLASDMFPEDGYLGSMASARTASPPSQLC